MNFAKYRGRGLRWYAAIPLMAFRVIRYRLRTFSPYHLIGSRAQYHEDLLLWAMLGRRRGYCVEVGANDGVFNSNTYLFEKRGWSGLLVEPSPDAAARCRRRRPRFTTVQAAVGGPDIPAEVTFTLVPDSQFSYYAADPAHLEAIRREFGSGRNREVAVPAFTLDSILDQAQAPCPLDFVTIDVEGMEFDVLRGFSIEKWRPQVVILERNAPEFDPRILDYMDSHGYRFLRTTPETGKDGNDWFVRRDF